MTSVDPGTLIMSLLESALDYVSDHLADLSNQAVDGGQFDWDGARWTEPADVEQQ